ncbi:MAG: hypothetical protein HYR71_12365 [Chloroflexi bacterium]|nr:hypothetical protein [Chloroflexota bacterium]
MSNPVIVRLHDVLNYGGFFGGDTVTVTAHAVDRPAVEQTITIDQGALTNVGDRYQIVGGAALALEFEGERVSSATLIGMRERAALRQAVTTPAPPLDGPRLFAYHCADCGLWILGQPLNGQCGVEGHALP